MTHSGGIRFRLDPRTPLSAHEQIRDQLINYLHLGLLAPGARLPAVRELATQTGLNLKTAFRLYRHLAREELVDIQPRRGAFVRFSGPSVGQTYKDAVKAFLDRALSGAEQFHLSPRRFVQLLASRAGVQHAQNLRCAVVECNREQTDLFSAELRHKLNVDAFPVLTHSSPGRRDRALRRADVFITTDYHWDEVRSWVAQHRKEAYRIRLNPAFHRLLVRNARRGLFPMILTDVSFEPRFRRALSGMLPSAAAEHLVLVHYRDRARLRHVLAQARRAYVSPLCYQQVAKQAPPHVRLITLKDMISRESLLSLRRTLRV